MNIIIQAQKGYKNIKTKKYYYFATSCDFANLDSSNFLYLCLTFLCARLSIKKVMIILSTSYSFSSRDKSNRYFLNFLTIIITKKQIVLFN